MNTHEKWTQLSHKFLEKPPIGITFQTEKNYYYYDTPTGKILKCGELEFQLINSLLNQENIVFPENKYSKEELNHSVDTILTTVEKYDILRLSQFDSMHLTENYKDMVENHLHQITLELTERCNLRCGYCIYHEGCSKNRNFGINDMSQKTAFQAIEYAKLHSSKEQELHIGFYGGEPLLCYPLLISCIEYAAKMMPDKTLYFSFTTNGVLLNKKMAEELNSVENLTITVSLDGPQNIHDTYRIDGGGKGSFENTIAALKLLTDTFGYEKTKKQVLLSMVYAPPYSMQKLKEIQDFFESLPWFPRECVKYITYPDAESFSSIKNFANEKKNSAILAELEKDDATLIQYADRTWEEETFTSRIFYDKYLRVYRRAVLSEAYPTIPMNGCCVPGQRKIYVSVDGELKLCEKVGNIPSVGTLENGFDYNFAKKTYLDDYAEKSLLLCSTCWLARLCNICYSNCYSASGFDLKKKSASCKNSKISALQVLISYFTRLEQSPDIFDAFSEAVLK